MNDETRSIKQNCSSSDLKIQVSLLIDYPSLLPAIVAAALAGFTVTEHGICVKLDETV